jgi:DNA-binding transcriptional LysR family regulator
MDRLDAMAVLIAVVEEGSLSAGARRLRSPVATVSRKVSELEEQLGTRLLVRTSRHLALTEAGRHYLDAARRILEQVDEAERAAAGEYTEPRGDLVVTAATDFARRHILPLAAEFWPPTRRSTSASCWATRASTSSRSTFTSRSGSASRRFLARRIARRVGQPCRLRKPRLPRAPRSAANP